MKRARSLHELTQRNVELIGHMEKESEAHRTFGERAADSFAATVGSWTFLIAQTIVLGAWIALNVVAWSLRWDPYPFILLNLVLSFQAAYAAPIIMMSQNRQARLSERRNHLDLQINLLAEQETTEILRLLRKLCVRSGVSLQGEGDIKAMAQATHPQELIEQIRELVEQNTNNCPPSSKEAVSKP
jgi:uncharacterized membrane protein